MEAGSWGRPKHQYVSFTASNFCCCKQSGAFGLHSWRTYDGAKAARRESGGFTKTGSWKHPRRRNGPAVLPAFGLELKGVPEDILRAMSDAAAVTDWGRTLQQALHMLHGA